ncbi:MAG: AmmeMemoRadiSam system protein A [Magnetococcales bacterium]|nr:AmmeMemoRadiSam system protein A [Magnetococcales bacterium]MBF0321437.1 AmmeMemoRadiSam system protein A [Magnetococcales bacterium]
MQGQSLTTLVRTHLQQVLAGKPGLMPAAVVAAQPELQQPGACFITLTRAGQLQGCIGSLEAHRPLVNDLLENAVASATRDPRFPPLKVEVLPEIRIEVSLLTPPQPFPYRDVADLMVRLQPGIHGVTLSLQGRRATFLPQVWEQLPDPEQFLRHLCQKAGLPGNCCQQHPEIFVYMAEKFKE